MFFCGHDANPPHQPRPSGLVRAIAVDNISLKKEIQSIKCTWNWSDFVSSQLLLPVSFSLFDGCCYLYCLNNRRLSLTFDLCSERYRWNAKVESPEIQSHRVVLKFELALLMRDSICVLYSTDYSSRDIIYVIVKIAILVALFLQQGDEW